MIYADGYAVQDEEYGYYPETMNPLNAAHPSPSRLTQPLKGFNLLSDIFLGGRSDLNADRHLLGKMASVQVYIAALNADQAECVFRFGESVLPDPNSIAGLVPDCGTSDELDILFIGDYHDRSPSAHSVTLGGAAAVDVEVSLLARACCALYFREGMRSLWYPLASAVCAFAVGLGSPCEDIVGVGSDVADN